MQQLKHTAFLMVRDLIWSDSNLSLIEVLPKYGQGRIKYLTSPYTVSGITTKQQMLVLNPTS